jgi:HSP20 family protein
MATWDPFDGLELLRRDIDQAFDRVGRQLPSGFRSAFLPGLGAREYPLINIYDDQEKFLIEALAPGAEPGSFNVTAVGNMLTISGEKRRAAGDVKPEAFHREERAAGKFARSIEISTDFDENSVKAEYKNGLLLIQLAKSEKAKPRQINVQVAS